MTELNVDGMALAPGVVETIVSIAANEVEGVACIGPSTTSGLRSVFGSKPSTQGIDITVDEEDKLHISIRVDVYYGYVLPDLAANIRQAISDAVTSQVGIPVGSVDVYIDGMHGICILMIYLILSALYESFIVPFAVILAVPVGLMGTFLFAKIAGLENNIYLQTGLIMLIGLLAKTAILLTEYAAERRKAGMGLIASAVSAAKARLRPILMTALTMIFGLFPLVVATGVGANGNRSLGTGVVGGMTIGTLALLFIVPALFVTFQWLQERLRPAQSMPTKDWQIEEEMEVSKKEIEESHK